jgi:hypothetical protein
MAPSLATDPFVKASDVRGSMSARRRTITSASTVVKGEVCFTEW